MENFARAVCGLEICSPSEVHCSLKYAAQMRYEFLSIPLVHPRFKRELISKWKERLGPFTRPDMTLRCNEWSCLIIGKISSYSDIECEFLDGSARYGLEQELNYGSHLNLSAVIVPIRSSNFVNCARIVNSHLVATNSLNVWLEIPLIANKRIASKWRSDLRGEEPVEHTWEWWTQFHLLCNFDTRLGIVLEITSDNPDEKMLEKWRGEPIKGLILTTRVFKTNRKGYPILSKPIQCFIKNLAPNKVSVIVRGNNDRENLDLYRKYLNNLGQTAASEAQEPRNDLLDSCKIPFTFNSFKHYSPLILKEFEDNVIQYNKYIMAIEQAMLDKSAEVLNIMILNSGKGVLIFSTLEIAAKCNQRIKIFAAENNRFESMALKSYQREFWKDAVEIISEDLDCVNFPPIIDIIVTETLGTFGDDYLAPEIFDKAQKCLKEGGIFIPESYTSYVCPIQCTKAYSELKDMKSFVICEIPAGVVLNQTYSPSTVKPLFSFRHPNYNEHANNSRYKCLSFTVEQNCTLHGFIGFFQAVLYKDIKLEYLPDSDSLEIKDWNPIFFPIVTPVNLKTEDEIKLHFWRFVNKAKFWYEWTITKPIALKVHNPNGRYFQKDVDFCNVLYEARTF